MTDLHTRLVAAVHARAAVARAATPGPWFVDNPNQGSEYFPFWTVRNDEFVTPSGDEDAPALDFQLHTGCAADAELVAANGPDVVLRQCEADLRRLERHAPYRHYPSQETPDCAYCYTSQTDNMAWPCDDYLDIAAAYGVEVGDDRA